MHSFTKPLFITGLLLAPTIVAAQELGRLTAIPFVDQDASIGELVYGLYLVAITLAAVFAVVKLTIAGIKYMTSDVVSSKESAKSDIKGAILGLLLLLATVLIVDVINENIADTDISLRGDLLPANSSLESDNVASKKQTLCESDAGCEVVTCGVGSELFWRLPGTSCEEACVSRDGVYEETFGGFVSTNYCYLPGDESLIIASQAIRDAATAALEGVPADALLQNCVDPLLGSINCSSDELEANCNNEGLTTTQIIELENEIEVPEAENRTGDSATGSGSTVKRILACY